MSLWSGTKPVGLSRIEAAPRAPAKTSPFTPRAPFGPSVSRTFGMPRRSTPTVVNMSSPAVSAAFSLRECYRASADRFVRTLPALGDLAVLIEPTSVVIKAWDDIEHIGHRGAWQPLTALVTGAGLVGLLAHMVGVERGYQVTVLDQIIDGPKATAARNLGAAYATRPDQISGQHDIVVECNGADGAIAAALRSVAADGVVCLIDASPHQPVPLSVRGNIAVFGSVHANRRHYEAADAALAAADPKWLRPLVTRRVPLDQWTEALQPSRPRHQDPARTVAGRGVPSRNCRPEATTTPTSRRSTDAAPVDTVTVRRFTR